jgi:hypothetical protein
MSASTAPKLMSKAEYPGRCKVSKLKAPNGEN